MRRTFSIFIPWVVFPLFTACGNFGADPEAPPVVAGNPVVAAVTGKLSLANASSDVARAGDCSAMVVRAKNDTGTRIPLPAYTIEREGTNRVLAADCATPVESSKGGAMEETIYLKSLVHDWQYVSVLAKGFETGKAGQIFRPKTPSRVEIRGPAEITTGECQGYVATVTDTNGLVVPPEGNLVLTFKNTSPFAMSVYPSRGDCLNTTNAVTNRAIDGAKNEHQSIFFVKPEGAGTLALDFTTNQTISTTPKPARAKLAADRPPVVSRLAAGNGFTCFVHSGKVYCVGKNDRGQLGRGTTESATTAAAIAGLPLDMRSVFAGESHACGLSATGGLFCWGDNRFAQLGSGATTESSPTPAAVTGLSSGVQSVGLGARHSCAVHDGVVKCWGANDFGQLGDRSTIQRATPVASHLPAYGYSIVAAARDTTCANSVDFGLVCFGKNDRGQLGAATGIPFTSTPYATVLLTHPVEALSASHSDDRICALHDGEIECWGNAADGRFGDAGQSSGRTLVPVRISTLDEDVTSIAIGGAHACAVHQGNLKCWGDNTKGSIGDGTTLYRPAPTAVTGYPVGTAFDAIATGTAHSCALSSNVVRCWGDSPGAYGL